MENTVHQVKVDEFIDRFAAKGYTKKDSAMIVREFLDIIYEAIRNGEEVALHGFGVIGTIKAKEKKVMNIQTGVLETIPPHNKVKFRPGVILKRAAEGLVD